MPEIPATDLLRRQKSGVSVCGGSQDQHTSPPMRRNAGMSCEVDQANCSARVSECRDRRDRPGQALTPWPPRCDLLHLLPGPGQRGEIGHHPPVEVRVHREHGPGSGCGPRHFRHRRRHHIRRVPERHPGHHRLPLGVEGGRQRDGIRGGGCRHENAGQLRCGRQLRSEKSVVDRAGNRFIGGSMGPSRHHIQRRRRSRS